MAVDVLWVLIALVAGAWAGLLALAEESPRVSRTLGDGASEPDTPASYRAIYVSRLVLLLTASVGAALATRWWLHPPIPAAGIVIVSAGFLYMVAEALPRAAGVVAPEVAASAAPMAGRTVAPFRPLLALATALERLSTRWLPGRAEDPGAEDSLQRDLLLGVFSLGDTTVAEIMTPRIDIVAVPEGTDWNGVVEILRRSEHARLPVFRETLDDIVGILYAKDMVAAVAGLVPPPERWQDLIRPAQFVPESKSLAAQLHDFQRGPGHLALVVDEFGGTSGLLTLEDTLEEVVGEIHDEYDVDEEPAVEREGDDKFWVDGALTLDELSALLGTKVDDEDVSTVGGLVYSELGHVPRPGEEFQFGHFRVVVEQMIRRRIRRVYFERQDRREPVDAEPERGA